MSEPHATSAAAQPRPTPPPSWWRRFVAWWRSLRTTTTPWQRPPPPDPALVASTKAALSPWAARQKKTAWRPVRAETTTRVDGGDERSQFAGDPLLPDDFAWPACASCHKPMRFLLQLDLATLPDAFAAPVREGLLSFFCCDNDSPDASCETWRARSGCHALSIFAPSVSLKRRSGGPSPSPEHVIIAWNAIEDLPSDDDHERCGLRRVSDPATATWALQCDDPPLRIDGLPGNFYPSLVVDDAQPGDKLGGWPFWVQTAEWQTCSRCGSEMQLVLQVDSNDNVDIMFGDTGCGHIMQCSTHPDELTFAWACC